GSFPVRLPIATTEPPVHMTLYAAHVEATANGTPDVDAGTGVKLINGMLNGGLKTTEIHDRLVPAIAAMLNNIVVNHGTGYMMVLSFFDSNKDGMISTSEVDN